MSQISSWLLGSTWAQLWGTFRILSRRPLVHSPLGWQRPLCVCSSFFLRSIASRCRAKSFVVAASLCLKQRTIFRTFMTRARTALVPRPWKPSSASSSSTSDSFSGKSESGTASSFSEGSLYLFPITFWPIKLEVWAKHVICFSSPNSS